MNRASPEAVDFVAIGGGLAGLAGANRAAEAGLRVLVIEQGRDAHYASNSRFTAGIFHVCHRDLDCPVNDLIAAVGKTTAGFADPDLARALCDDALRAYDWLKSQGVQFTSVPAMNRHYVLAPPRINRPGLHWQGRGGDRLLATLEAKLERRGGRLLRGARGRELLMADGRCVGVIAERDGQPMRIEAAAVLIADGGFQADRSRVNEFITARPERLMQRNAGTGAGDGLRMAVAAGADLAGMQSGFYGHLLCRDAMENENLWPFPILDALGSAGIVVDADGRRFADEGIGGVFMANAVARLADPLSSTVIFDQRVWEEQGQGGAIAPNPHLLSAGGRVQCHATLDELAADLGLPAQALAKTVGEYNAAIHRGGLAALEVGRSISRYEACPIETPPFYAVRACAGITFTMGGIRIDANGRVLRSDGTAIAGLFAAGSTTGGLDGGRESGYVGGLIKAAVFGLRAAECACGGASAAASP